MKDSKTIYIVDDDISASRGLSNLLNAAGYDVEAFVSVEDFLQVQFSNTDTCLIIDARVSGLSTKNLQAQFLQKNVRIPIIFLSARDDKTSRDKAVETGAVGFFRKPVDGPALLDAIAWLFTTGSRVDGAKK